MTAADYPGLTWHVADADSLERALGQANPADSILINAPGGVWVPLGTEGRAVRVYIAAVTAQHGQVVAITTHPDDRRRADQ